MLNVFFSWINFQIKTLIIVQNLILLIFYFCSFFSICQIEYNHSAGVSCLIGNFSNQSTYVSNSYLGLNYNPRLDFKLHDEVSIGFSFYPTVSYSLNSTNDSRNGGSSSSTFCYEMPMLVQLNLGQNSTIDSEMMVGGFLGAGLNQGTYSGIYSDGSQEEGGALIMSTGKYKSLCLQVGTKFIFNDVSYGIRFEYNKPMAIVDLNKVNIYGVGIFMNFLR